MAAQRMSVEEWRAWKDRWYAYGTERLTDADVTKVVLHVHALESEITELRANLRELEA
jgi:hypothetical protein